MGFRVVRRGSFRTLFRDDKPVDVVSVHAAVVSPQHVVGTKTYMTVRIRSRSCDIDEFADIDRRIRDAQPDLAYSPLRNNDTLVIKVPKDVVWDGDDGHAWNPLEGARLRLDLRLGSFGPFGYCWLARRIARDTD